MPHVMNITPTTGNDD